MGRSDELGDPGGDGVVYVLTARVFSPCAQADATHSVADTRQFPQPYPLILALTGAAPPLCVPHDQDARVSRRALLLAAAAAAAVSFWHFEPDVWHEGEREHKAFRAVFAEPWA